MTDRGYFPILVEWQDTKEKEVIIHPEFLDDGRAFKVVKLNVNSTKGEEE